MKASRREFIKKSSLTAAGTLLVPQFLKAFEQWSPMQSSEKILVVIQLSGGNDGLNTIIPYRNDIYYKQRPKLSIPKEKIVEVTDELGFHPSLSNFKELFDQGYLSIINSVGYPNPDRSHFRSMDIWQSASASNEYLTTGWIGRYLDASCQNCNVAHKAIELDDSLSLAMKGRSIKGLALKNPERLYRAMHNNFFQHLAHEQNTVDDTSVGYLYKTLAETISSADYIYGKSKIRKSDTEYPRTDFANRLKTVAELISSGLDTKVYYVSLSGFDTHIHQKGTHATVLQNYSDSLFAFVKDLEKSNRFGDVMIMTFSEFGRRVSENASEGTDHGTANNLFIVGKNLNKKGFFNASPDLSQLDQGDLTYQVDFRDIYATLLDKWLDSRENKILTSSTNLLDFI